MMICAYRAHTNFKHFASGDFCFYAQRDATQSTTACYINIANWFGWSRIWLFDHCATASFVRSMFVSMFNVDMKLATCFEKGIWLACTRESVSVHPFYVAFVWAWRNPIKTSLRVREYIFTSGCDVNLTVVINVKNERMLPAASIHRHGFPLTNIKLQHSNGIWEITRIVESQLNIFDRCLLWEI